MEALDWADRLRVVQKVEEVKQTINGDPESKTNRKIVTKTIGKETSRQEFYPPLGR